jgi:hypothetical protein
MVLAKILMVFNFLKGAIIPINDTKNDEIELVFKQAIYISNQYKLPISSQTLLHKIIRLPAVESVKNMDKSKKFLMEKVQRKLYTETRLFVRQCLTEFDFPLFFFKYVRRQKETCLVL